MLWVIPILLKYLIESGADINIQDQDNNTPLILAAIEGNIKIVNLLLKKGANTDIKNTQMNTALHYASINGNIPLGLASCCGHHVIVRMLLKKCTTPDWCRVREYFIFLYVISEGYIEVFKALLEHEPNLCNAKVEEERATALMLALASENIELVKILLQYNPDLNIQTTTGETALHLAVELGNLEIVEMLVRKGANIYITNKDGISPLLYARCNNLKVMQILLKYGRTLD
ncbi:ankyrin repeat domain-containing protein [Holosporaceae bacterium 'Namur']|nr:ankyrin repeat domain-containing protein [Holosporaceae bacterium 'Namur']